MKKKEINVGLIGTGFMGKIHSNAYRQVDKFFEPEFRILTKVVCGRNEARLKEFREKWGWEEYEADWRKIIERNDIDLIDIATPNSTHQDIAIAAAEAGKMVVCEKPLARNSEEGKRMVQAVEKAGVPNMVWFNYRRFPAIALAKQIISEGKLGRVFHYRTNYLQDWTINPKLPQGGNTYWRLDAEIAGSGVTGDMLSHSIDLAIWLNGEISSVTAMTETFIKEREYQGAPGKLKPVTIDDACTFLARFNNGATGTFEASRYARGRKNHNTLEINGEKASLCFDLKIAHQIQYYSHGDSSTLRGWRCIQVIDSDHPYMKSFWVSGLPMGYEHTFINTLADFLEGLSSGKKKCPDFKDALTVQRVCDAILFSADKGKWENIP